jgi:broad specificity phosphatase PhoE
MGTIVLVRHGQASVFEAEYDKLSPQGETQARLLGEHLARRGVRFDAVFAGPRERQQRTAEIARAASGGAGVPWPEITALPALDEMQVQTVLATSLPALAAADPSVRALAEALPAAAGPAARLRAFERLFQAVMLRWVDGQIDAPGVEPWPAFCARVAGALATLRASCGGGRRVAAFTSAGPLALCTATALGASERAAVELLFVVKNTALAEILSSGARLSLLAFNALPHLAAAPPELETYR